MTYVVTRQRAQEVHDRARARAGLPYAYGGAFTLDPRVSTDCSGLVLQTAAWYMGRTDWVGNRYGSTESFRLDHKIVYDLGFRRMPPGGLAALPFKPVMLVGLQHGGGGMYSHTACTLMTMDIPGGPVKMSDRGVDWESHGNVNGVGVSLYDGARAWNDPLFHDFWYLDAKLEDAPANGVDLVGILTRATGISPQKAVEILPTLQQGLKLAECTNDLRIAMALAQWGHESASFNATAEYASGAAYEGSIDLGNTQPGDGVRFKGRTWIQITGRHNYTAFSRWAYDKGLVPTPDYFVVRPTELADMKWAGVGAAWYWTVQRPQINRMCDQRDLVGVTHAVNGGENGLYEPGGRRDRYNRALLLGNQLLALINEEDDPLADPELARMIREVHACLFNKTESTSDLATPGEGARWMLHEKIHNLDGMIHPLHAERRARAGDLGELHRIVQAARGLGAKRDPVTVRVYQNIVASIERDDKSLLEAYIAAYPPNGTR